MRTTRRGDLAILAWKGNPEVKLSCGADGVLKLEEVRVHAFQAIDLPRNWNDPDREPDAPPHAQLASMFARVRAALHAWAEVTDHLRPRGTPG